MARVLIVVGDSLSGGGSVVSSTADTDIEGKLIARVGDRVVCRTHGPGSIVSGDDTLIIDGRPVARHGDKTSCGCTLIAGVQTIAFVDVGSAAASSRAMPPQQPAHFKAPSKADAVQAPGAQSQPTEAKPTAAASPAPEKTEANCWIKDHQKTATGDSVGRHYELYDHKGQPLYLGSRYKFSISAPLQSGGAITLKVRFSAKAMAAAKGQLDQVKADFVAAVGAHWNGKYTAKITDPKCGSKNFPIRYEIEWVPSGGDYVFFVHDKLSREYLEDSTLHVQVATDAWSYAHEFGHCIGLPDEYSSQPGMAMVRFYRPDGSLDSTPILTPKSKDAADPSATIMSSYYSTTQLPRHAWAACREVSAMLTAALGRKITCEVI